MVGISSTFTKQKRRIALLFSLSIFLFIIFLEAGLLSYKYRDYNKQEMGRLWAQAENTLRLFIENPEIIKSIGEGHWFILPNIRKENPRSGPRNDRRNIRMENFFLFNERTGKILFSPIQDDDTYNSVLLQIGKEDESTFSLGENEYFFIKKKFPGGVVWIFFSESRLTAIAVWVEFMIYLLGALVVSSWVYFVSSRFIDRTMAPVEENLEQMEHFIHNAWHELKTPIAVIKSSLELMKIKENYTEGIKESIYELNRMNQLIDTLLELSTPNLSKSTEVINIVELVEEIVKNNEENIHKKQIQMNILNNSKEPLIANREYLGICLNNIISNSIKYNKQGGSIDITIYLKSIEIKDTGIGIEKENIEKVFDRFYKEGEVRDEYSFGIGLSLVQKITETYGWKIAIQSEKNIGTTVKLTF